MKGRTLLTGILLTGILLVVQHACFEEALQPMAAAEVDRGAPPTLIPHYPFDWLAVQGMTVHFFEQCNLRLS